jgi:hypothetical protein
LEIKATLRFIALKSQVTRSIFSRFDTQGKPVTRPDRKTANALKLA